MNNPFDLINRDDIKRARDAMDKLHGVDLDRIFDIQKTLSSSAVQDALRAIHEIPKFSLPDIAPLPKLKPMDYSAFKIPTPAEQNYYQSAEILILRLRERYEAWCAELPEDVQPAIYALTGGVVLRVASLTQESFHGIAVDGAMLDSNARCLLIAHQASLQLLCVAEPVTAEQPKRRIGFYVASEQSTDED